MLGVIFWLCIALVVYVYAGYPFIVFFFSRLFGKQVEMGEKLPYVTLLFSALNEEKIIAKKLENSLELDYPQTFLQILVVSDGSTDQTASIVSQYIDKGVEFMELSQRKGKLAALKSALPLVKGEVILFSDADNFYPAKALRETVKYFETASVGAISGGRNVIGGDALGNAEGMYWKYEEFIKKHESRLGSCVGVAGDLLAIRKNLYIPPPENVINDDFYNVLSILKQGYRVIYAPEARSFHPVAGSEKQEMGRRARMVAGRYQAIFSFWKNLPWNSPVAVWQIVSHKYLRPLVPLFMIGAFVVNAFSLVIQKNDTSWGWLFLWSPYNWIFFVLQIAFYLLAWIGLKRKFPGFIGKLFYVPAFLVNSNWAALQGLYRFLTSRQTVFWKKADR